MLLLSVEQWQQYFNTTWLDNCSLQAITAALRLCQQLSLEYWQPLPLLKHYQPLLPQGRLMHACPYSRALAGPIPVLSLNKPPWTLFMELS